MIRHVSQLTLAAGILVLGSQGLHTAIANGDTRAISLHHAHRGDDITVTFKRNGRYDPDGLKKLNHFLRDWRTDDVTNMDPQLFDAMWEVLREFGTDKKAHIISSYRSPRTNEMLRRRSNGVARHSLHTQGKAIDFFVPGVPLDKVREAGLRLQRGGVGFYPTSGSPFVHMDVGNVRHWPRMTREQLVKVFPTGRTVHLPTDGKPLSGYALAQAEIEKRGSGPSALDSARMASADSKSTNALARMFGFGKQKPAPATDDDEADEVPAAAPRQVASASPMPMPAPLPAQPQAPVAMADIPMPKAKPVTTIRQTAEPQVAAAQQPAQQPLTVAGAYRLAGISPNDIISARGYWQGLPDSQEGHILNTEPKVASAGATGSIGPFAAPPGYGMGRSQQTLAFASPVAPEPDAQRPQPMGNQMPRAAAVAANTTVAAKAKADAGSEVRSAPAITDAREAELRRWDGPFMRALVMTPSVVRFMNTTLYGMQDYRSLQPLLQKPEMLVVMAFAHDSSMGPGHLRFEGRAIEFLAITTFQARSTAALR